MTRTATLPAAPSSPRSARTMVTEAMVAAGLPSEVIEDVKWLTSELATNAVVHAGTAFVVSIEISEDAVRVAVDDTNPSLPRVRPPDGVSGRGLHLMERVAACWGIDAAPVGKSVWFQIER